MNASGPIEPSRHGEPGSAASRPGNLAFACSAEAIGTFLLVWGFSCQREFDLWRPC